MSREYHQPGIRKKLVYYSIINSFISVLSERTDLILNSYWQYSDEYGLNDSVDFFEGLPGYLNKEGKKAWFLVLEMLAIIAQYEKEDT